MGARVPDLRLQSLMKDKRQSWRGLWSWRIEDDGDGGAELVFVAVSGVERADSVD